LSDILRGIEMKIDVEGIMIATLTSKGQVTIPKQIRDALDMTPGCSMQFAVNQEGDVVIHKVGARASRKPDRFEAARGKADVKWRADDLMALLRGDTRIISQA
jgi:AbrB family looped-hinge helix DNA binding protein